MTSYDFKPQLIGEVYIPSREKASSSQEVGTQSEVLRISRASTQTDVSSVQVSEKLEKGEGHERLKLTQASLQGGWQYIYTNAEYDEEKLANFLESTESRLYSILQKNVRMNSYDNYVPNWSKRSTELSLVYTLSSPVAMEHELHALDVAWNFTGAVLAVAYGRLDVSGWCNTSGCACVWNFSRSDMDVYTPHFTLETDTHVTKVEFHPKQTSCLALGTYGGDVVIYPNFAEPQNFSADQGNFSHRYPICSLEWIQNLQETREVHRYILCVGSQDGKLSMWSLANNLKTPLRVYNVDNRRHVSTGVAAVTFARPPIQDRTVNIPSIDNAIIVGLENGDVGRGRITLLPRVDELKEGAPVVPVPLPLDWMKSHYGPIQTIQSSPFFRNLFLSCSSDGTVRLYHLIDSNAPQLTLEPSSDTRDFLYCAQFSPFRPSVVAVASRSSSLHIYDLQKSKAQPSNSSKAGVEEAPVVCLQFCNASADWLATGDTRGNARVWKLPTELTQQTEVERSTVRNAQRPSHENSTEENQPFREIFGFLL